MLLLLVPMLFQAAAGAPQPAIEQDGASAKAPEVVCRMEPVTGTRAKRQKVCRTKNYEKGSEQMRDQLRSMQNGPGAPAPGAPG